MSPLWTLIVNLIPQEEIQTVNMKIIEHWAVITALNGAAIKKLMLSSNSTYTPVI
jgi:hypothetical protein